MKTSEKLHFQGLVNINVFVVCNSFLAHEKVSECEKAQSNFPFQDVLGGVYGGIGRGFGKRRGVLRARKLLGGRQQLPQEC